MSVLTGNERVFSLVGQPVGTPMVNSGQNFDVRSGHVSMAGSTTSTSTLNVTASTALVNIPGLQNTITGPGTYRFLAFLAGTANSSGGVQVAFSYSNMTLSSLNAVGIANTTAAQALSVTTTTASGTALISSTTAVVFSEILGTMVVSSVAANTGGTIQLQFAQSASTAATSSINAGSYMQIALIG